VPQYNKIKPSGGDTGKALNLQKRLVFIQKHVTLENKTLLDCGCGTGQYMLALLTMGVDAFGIECSEDKVRQFRQNNPKNAERIILGDIEHMTFDDNSFDIALLNEVLEHIPSEVNALSEIHRILKPNGILIIFSPNRLYPFETHGVTLSTRNKRIPPYIPLIPYIPLRYGKKIFRYHARNYWPKELRHIVQTQKFEITYTGYIWQTFENISGTQPKIVSVLKPLLRKIFTLLESIPLVQTFGVSQVIIAKKAAI